MWLARLEALGILAAACMVAHPVRADWPIARQNPRRTASTAGSSDMDDPQAFWRLFLGGALTSDSVLSVDVDGDLTPEVIIASAGRVAARDVATGDVLWESGQLEIQGFVGLADLDGDSTEEIIAHSSDRIHVLSQAGGVVWTQPDGDIGTVGGYRLADFSGDGIDDLWVMDCGCCAVVGETGGRAYRFTGSGASLSSPAVLWTMASIPCAGARANAVAAMRNPSQGEPVFSSNTGLAIADAQTGAVAAESPPLGQNIQRSRCFGLDVVGSPADELICIASDPLAPDGMAHRVLALEYKPSPPRLEELWQRNIGTVDGAVEIPASCVFDQEADGNPELIFAGREDESAPWSSYVVRSTDGEIVQQLQGLVVGTTTTPDGPLVFVNADGGVNVYRYVPAAADLQKVDTVVDSRLVTTHNFARAALSEVNSETLTTDINSDGQREVIFKALAGDRLSARVFVDGKLAEVASYVLPQGASVLGAWAYTQIGATARALVMAQSDGNLHAFDSNLAPVTGNPQFGVRFGGYYATSARRALTRTPILSAPTGGQPVAVVTTSKGSVARIDLASATFAQPPPVLWERPSTHGPIVVGSAKSRQVIAIGTPEDDQHQVLAMSIDGDILWTHTLAGVALTDLLPLRRNDAIDVFVQWGNVEDRIERSVTLSGSNGAPIWQGPSYGPGNRQPSGAAVADWTGDGVDDVVMQWEATRVLDGVSGEEVLSSPPGWSYYTPMLADVDGDEALEATLYAGFWPASTLDSDLQTVLWEGEDDLPLNYAALVECDGEAPSAAAAATVDRGLLKFVRLAGAAAGQFDVLVLAGGEMYSSADQANADGKRPGLLGSPAIHENLAGDGAPKLLIGSSDGWLYGLDACTRTLAFARDFGAPVGAIVYGDGDGDGADEIIVSVADGYLYGLKQASIEAVDHVIDTDPPNGIVNEDVDEIVTDNALYAAWNSVPGADAYEVSVVRDEIDGGGLITFPEWVDVGDSTAVSIGNLPLVDGKRYFVAVRAIAEDSRSPDRLSDGVRVTIVPGGKPPGEPPRDDTLGPPVILNGRSCVYFCGIANSSLPIERPWGWAWLAAVLGLGIARRRLQN